MLFHAVEMNDEKLLDEVLECFTKENFFPVLKLTSKSIVNFLCNPLQLAIQKGNCDLVKKILDKIPEENIPELLQLRVNDPATYVNNKTLLQLAIFYASYYDVEENFKMLRELLILIQKLPLDKQKEQLSANTLIKLSSLQPLRTGPGPAAGNFKTPHKTNPLREILDNISPDLQLQLLSAKNERGELPIELFINQKNEEAVLKILDVIKHFSDEDKKKCLPVRIILILIISNNKEALKKIFEILPKDRMVEGLKIKLSITRSMVPPSPSAIKNSLGAALYCDNQELALLVFKEILKLNDSDRKECISTESLNEALCEKMTDLSTHILTGLKDSEESKKILTSLLKQQRPQDHPHYPGLAQNLNALNIAVWLSSETDERMLLNILNLIKNLSEKDKQECLLETTLSSAVYYKKPNIVRLIFEIASNDLIERSLHYHEGVNKEDGTTSSEMGSVMQEAINNSDEEMIGLIWTKSQGLSEDCRAKLKRDIRDYEDMTDQKLKTLLKVVPVEIFEGNADKILKISDYYRDEDTYNDAVLRTKTLLEAICKLDDADQKITKYFPLNWFNQNMKRFRQSKDFRGLFKMLPTKSRLSYMQHNQGKLNLLENAFLTKTDLIPMLLNEIEKLEDDKEKATCLFDEKKGYSAFFQLFHRKPEYLDDLLNVFNNLSDEVKLDWLRVRNSAAGQTALHYALGVYRDIRKSVVLKLIDAIPQANRRELLLIENKKHKSAWDIADTLQGEILAKLSDDDRKLLLEKPDDRLTDSRTGKKARKENADNNSASSSSASAASSSSAGGLSSSAGKRRRAVADE